MLESIIGQKNAKETVKILIESTKQSSLPFPHSLFTGSAGVGKSSFARAIAKELGHKFTEINSACTGSASEIRIKLIIAMEDMKENDILLLDEFHAITKSSQEILYTAIENGYVTFGGDVFGSKIKVAPFTLLGATTDLSGLTNSMQTRFKYVIELQEYNLEEIAEILDGEAITLGFKLDSSILANYCRGNPRIAKNYLDWIHRYCKTKNLPPNLKIIKEAMVKKGVYLYGLTYSDLLYIEVLKRNKIMGVRAISNTINVPEKTVKAKIEPYLLKLGVINILQGMQNKRGINKNKIMELGL